ncbi:hypothetical protein I3760_Q020700 [Carya illinoinensis]|nr:hypothetical protein I3760_Q020700 [Carya illinoinensis]
MVLRKINTILSSFLWGENNGKGKRKWCYWDKVCKPVSECGVGVRDLAKVQKSFHMKFAWRLMAVDNLWTRFFKAKYFRHGHMAVVTPSQNDSRFWKLVLKVFPEVYENMYVKIREGKASFWFDRWLSSGPLAKSIELVQRLVLKAQECWELGAWDTIALEELVGEEKINEILMSNLNQKVGSDVFVWKPTTNGKFSIASAWEVIRIKGMRRSWMDWVWHKLLPTRVSLCMWKALFHCLLFDERVRMLGISIVLGCDCCVEKTDETLNHVLSTGLIAGMVWKRGASVFGIMNVENEPWRVKISRWYRVAKKSTQKGTVIGLLPAVITWRLWLRRCKARMDGEHELGEAMWLLVRSWLAKIASGVTGLLYCSDKNFLEDLGDPGFCEGGGIIRDADGNMKAAFSEKFEPGTNNEAE